MVNVGVYRWGRNPKEFAVSRFPFRNRQIISAFLGHLHSQLIQFKHVEKTTRIIPNPEGPLDTENPEPFAVFNCVSFKFGYAATGIRDILQAAGVTQPTLYHHFADKASLLQTLIQRHYGESQQRLEDIIASEATVMGKLLAFVTSSFEHCCADPRVPRLMFQTYFGPTVPEIDGVLDKLTEKRFRLVVSIMENGMRTGSLAASNAEFLALAFCSMVDQPLNLFSRRSRPKKFLTAELAKSIVQLFLKGSASRG